MQQERMLTIKKLVQVAEKLPDDEQKTWLRGQCQNDPDLFRAVWILLRGEQTSTFNLRDTDEFPIAKVGDDLAGSQLGSWRLLRELGSGGMGSVWLAERADSEFQMMAAIKLIKNEQASNELIKRFRRERQILADLKHPNISMLLDGGTTADGMPYLVMEYVDGLVIDAWRAERTISAEEILLIFRQVCLAVGYAHQKGVLHRDIKPQNIMVTSEGLPKLMDFGIANKREEKDDSRTQHLLTPEYSPPESLVGGGKTRAADIYSLGLVLFHLLTGIRPRQAFGKWAETLSKLGQEKRRDLYLDLAVLLERMLKRDPSERIRSVEVVVNDIDRILADDRKGGKEDVSVAKAHYDAMMWYHPDQRVEVEDLARRLEDETGLKIWLNLWHLVPGEVEAAALATAYDQSACMLVFVGNGGRYPWDYIDQRGALTKVWLKAKRRVVPVLLSGANRPDRESGIPPFLRRCTWAELGSAVGHDELEVLARAIRGLPPGRPQAAPATNVCPFRGLEVFREEDQQFYHGREALTQRLFEHLKKHRFLAVLGPSGSGKSSVVQAGLVPLLRGRKARVAVFTPSRKPLEEMAFALLPAIYGNEDEITGERILDRLATEDGGLLDVILDQAANSEVRPLCLIVDQFEEIFTLSQSREQAARFINSLLYAVENSEHTYVVLTMRSDFLGKCASWPDLNNFVIDNMVQVEPMGEEELKRAIFEPARQVGLRFEEGLADRIMEDVQGASGELPLLEHALLELYERREGNMLTLKAFRDIGGVEGALATRAETEFNQLDEDSRGLLRKMFIHCLVQPGEGSSDTRRRATRGELLAEGTDKARIEALLNQWIDAHLLTSHYDARRKEEMVDVAHEALISRWARIHNWMEADRETARHLARLRRLSRTWHENNCDPDLLLRGAPLLRMVELLDTETLHLGQLERDFVSAGQSLHEAEQERKEALRRRELAVARGLALRARVITALTALGLVTVGLLAFRLYNSQEEERNKAEALQEVSNYIIDLFRITENEQEHSAGLTAKELVDRGARDLETRLQNQGETRARLLRVLGSIYHKMGEYNEALRLRLELLSTVEGTNAYRDQVAYSTELCATYYDMGRLDDARRMGEESVHLAREKLGNSTELASACHYLGATYARLGDYAKSKSLLEESLRLRRSLLGNKHLEVAQSLNQVATLLELLGEFGEAETLYRESLEMRLEMLGNTHILVAELFSNLAGNLMEQYRLDEAEEAIGRAIDVRTKLLGSQHPMVVDSIQELGVIYQRQGQMAKAEEVYRRVLRDRLDFLPENHYLIALSQSSLAAVMLRRGSLGTETEELFLASLEIYKKNFDEDHRFISDVLYDLAMLYQRKGQLDKAESYNQEALFLRRRKLGDEHVKVAHSLYQYGDLMTELGMLDRARMMGEEALSIYRNSYGEGSMLEAMAHALVIQANSENMLFERAEMELEACWRTLIEARSLNHHLTKRILMRLIDVCHRAGKKERAIYWKEEEKRLSQVASK